MADKKRSMKEIIESIKRKKNLPEKIKKIAEPFITHKTGQNRAAGTALKWIKIIIASTKKFLADDCMTKASSIAYTTIVSLIPTLTVILTALSFFTKAGDQKKEFFSRISLFMLEHNIKINIDPVFAAISGLIDNAGKIGIIGAVVMIFSATAMLRSLEKSLNHIWKVKKQRPMFLKVVYYWSALTLGPIMIIAGATAATKVQEAFSSPRYNAATYSEAGSWAVGTKNSIIKTSDKEFTFSEISTDTIDFKNQRTYRYDAASKQLKFSGEGADPLSDKKLTFLDIEFSGNMGWIVGKKGIILSTSDSGSTWQVKKLAAFTLNNICMIDQRQGFIAADSGILLRTSDGGETWQVQPARDVTANIKALSFQEDLGVAVGNRGTVLISRDRGLTWSVKKISPRGLKNIEANLNAIFYQKNKIWITGDNGLILESPDRGTTWMDRSYLKYDYTTGVHADNNIYISGSGGYVIRSADSGKTWKKIQLNTERINKLVYRKGRLYSAGDNGFVMFSDDFGKTWQGEEGGSSFAALLNFFAPFVFIWTLFLFAYMVLPNIKVPFKFAALGATFTGALWVTFILLFIVYIRAFAKGTFAIYGALVSIPLFLLFVYTSVLIVLYGAELSFIVMHPESYLRTKKGAHEEKRARIYTGLEILTAVYGKFEQGKGGTSFSELIKKGGAEADEIDYFTEMFLKQGLLLGREDETFIPAMSSTNIPVKNIISMVHSSAYSVPGSGKGMKKILAGIFERMNKSNESIIGDLSLQELIQKG